MNEQIVNGKIVNMMIEENNFKTEPSRSTVQNVMQYKLQSCNILPFIFSDRGSRFWFQDRERAGWGLDLGNQETRRTFSYHFLCSAVSLQRL